MAIPPRQIGWSQESNLLWEISKTLDFIQGNVGGLQGQITLTTTGNSGPATLVNNILNIPEYTIEGLGGVPETRTITINGESHDLSSDVAFTVLGQAVTVVANYSALPAPSTVPGAFFWVENSQGTYWLPGNLGGTFYNAGLYYSNGVVWQFMETPYQATQIEVDAGVNFTKFVTPLTLGAAAKWATKTEWKGTWTQQQYTINQQVLDEGYLAIANKTTVERPAPQRVGEPFNIYQGTIGSTTATAKQVIFGNKYSFLENVFFEGWRINVVAGNRYTVYLVRDPDGENIISQIIQFVAQSSGWVNLSAQSLIINAGNTYAVIAAVTEPTIVPITFNGNWNISQPQNITVPTSGQITQPRSDPGLLYINNIDNAVVNRSAELGSLEIGDVIKTGTNTWAIQSVSVQAGYFIFGVSPALLNVNIGIQNFIFEETSEATLTYPLDPNYWALNPSPIATMEGLLGIDIPYQDIIPDTTAYGIGVLLQTLVTSADWDIQAFSGASGGVGGGSGGGGATTLDELTDVEIVSPLDTEVLTYEGASGLWKNMPGGSGGGGVPTTRLININGNEFDLAVDREWRVAQGDTGALVFAGLTPNSSTTINIGALKGFVVNNESDPLIPSYSYIDYPGVTNITVPNLNPTWNNQTSTYVFIESNGVGGGNVVFRNSFPTSAQRKTGIWLGKVAHPAGTITVVINEPDYITSPQAFSRDLFQALGPYINSGVYPYTITADLSFGINEGDIFGNGINFTISNTDPNRIHFNGIATASYGYRTRTGAGGAAVTAVTPAVYDVAGVSTPVPGGPNTSTLQYLWAVPGAGGSIAYVMQLGQTTYGSLDLARAAVGKEANVVFPNLIGNAIPIAVLAVRSGATNLSLLTDAQFFRADKLGQISPAGGGSAGGGGATTLDQLTDVEIVTPADTQVLTYESATGLWKNKPSAGGGGSSIIQITITTSTNITTATTATDFPGEGQNGKNVILDNGATAIQINCLGGVTATYAKFGAGAVTFTAGAGRTLQLVDGTAVFNGVPGSTASLWSVGLIDYLRVSNA